MLYLNTFSYNDYLTYEILSGDTLESVSKKLGIEVSELRSYHNRYCPEEDSIRKDFPRHLKYIILQSQEEKQAKEAQREPIHFSNKDYKLPFQPQLLNKKYLAKYTISNGDIKYSLKEEFTIKWLSTDQNQYFFFEIDRKSLYVDEEIEKTMADKLAEMTAKVFYPLQVVVDSNGSYTAIHNFNQIRKRWPETKTEVLKEFEGEAVEERLKVFEKNIADDDTIAQSFSKDWFLRSFFSGIHIEYKEDLTIQNKIRFPVSQRIGEVVFDVKQSILPAVDKYNLVNVTQTGVLFDNRSKDDFENNLDFPNIDLDGKSEKMEGNFEAFYFLNPNTNIIDSLFLECEMKLNVPQKITIELSDSKEEGKLAINSRVKLYVPTDRKKEKMERETRWLTVLVVVIIAIAVYGIFEFFFNK
ncbi:hypothetical protein ACWA1F_02610 [Flavobacterium sp. 3-218]